MMRRGTQGFAAVAVGTRRWGPWLVAVLFVALGAQAALDAWRSFPLATTVPAASVASGAPIGPRLEADVAAIGDRHLFGSASAAIAAEPPQTRVALVLGGVWYAPTGAAYALIGEPGAAQRSYRVGERLPGDVELAGVEADRVLLKRDGQVETLALPHGSLAPRPPAPPRRGARADFHP